MFVAQIAPLSAAARPIRSHSASVAITARWRRPLASSLIAAIHPKGLAAAATHRVQTSEAWSPKVLRNYS